MLRKHWLFSILLKVIPSVFKHLQPCSWKIPATVRINFRGSIGMYSGFHQGFLWNSSHYQCGIFVPCSRTISLSSVHWKFNDVTWEIRGWFWSWYVCNKNNFEMEKLEAFEQCVLWSLIEKFASFYLPEAQNLQTVSEKGTNLRNHLQNYKHEKVLCKAIILMDCSI